jgi:predicted DNA-binding WGR domain protein
MLIWNYPSSLHLERIDPPQNAWRYYALSVGENLFGETELVCEWGRIGTLGRVRRTPYPDRISAVTALVSAAKAKGRRGYRPS